jgi:uncharacterized protein YjaZ
MTTVIDPTNDNVLNTFNQYHDILMLRYGDSDKERNLEHLAATLTQSHFMDHIECQLKELVHYEDLKNIYPYH